MIVQNHKLNKFSPNFQKLQGKSKNTPGRGGINQKAGINMCTLLHTYIHTYTHKYIYIYIYGLPWQISWQRSCKSACNAGNLGSIPELGRSPGEVNSYPLQYSGSENSMDCIVHGVAKSQLQRVTFIFTFTLLYIKQISNKQSIRNPTQYFVITYKGK